MLIIISPYSQKLEKNKPNPKNYPYWPRVCKELHDMGHTLIQIGVSGEQRLPHIDEYRFDEKWENLAILLKNADFFIAVDNFLHHFAALQNKTGIVIFSQSDPNIFGYPDQYNLLKDKKYIRPEQFQTWNETEYREEAFIEPEYVIEMVKELERNLEQEIQDEYYLEGSTAEE